MKGSSNKKKVPIRKSDFSRVILTDVHPYELPFIITNEGFYENHKSSAINKIDTIRDIFTPTKNRDTKPYIYEIAKDKDDTRKLFLPHPSAQINISRIYKDYNQLITYLCSKSKFSLRHPIAIATYYRAKDEEDIHSADDALKGEGVSIKEPKYASSFFEYKKVAFLYKFYDSYEFHRIERKFNKLMKFDIAKCFGSISTFMVPISLKGNDKYKRDINLHNFENDFSQVMSSLYDGNTHGIVVGPEFARIFAEILLQSIDIEIEIECSFIELEHGKNYEIRRYVDDFFLFYNDEATRFRVFEAVKKVLERYKLFVNDAKNLITETPFITGVSIAKKNIGDEITKFFNLFAKEAESGKFEITNDLRRYYQISNRMITDIKAIASEYQVPYSSITGYFFTMVRIKVAHIREQVSSGKFNLEHNERLIKFFLILIDYIFFVYQNDFRVRSTYIVSQIIIMIHGIFDDFGTEHKSQITKKIKDEIISSINFASRRTFLRHVESLNLLIALKVIGELKSITPLNLKHYLGFENIETKNVDYFNTVVFLYLTEEDPNYKHLKLEILDVVKIKLTDPTFTVSENSEATHIFFDLLSCPYLSREEKLDIIDTANKTGKLGLNSELDKMNFLEFVSSRAWFVDWSSNTVGHIEKLLMKKELKSPYS
jgi:hypothetical protein